MSSQTGYQRLLDIALALTAAGRVGVTTPELVKRVGYQDNESGKRKLMRDLDALRLAGLEIDNASELGEDARYVLRPGDTRWRLEFTPEQRSALQAALATAAAGTVVIERPAPADLDRVREAVRTACLLHFTYNSKPRSVDPISWRWASHNLVLEGWERDSEKVKTYAVSRISDLHLGEPGSARPRQDVTRPGLDPLTWLVDEPVTAVIECPGFTADVVALVGGQIDGDTVEVSVTNRMVFLARIVELGSRVRLVAPEELRADLRDLLRGAL